MADHLRKRIRAAAVAALTGLPTTGPRVYASRVYPLEDGDLPALLVKTEGEAIDTETNGRPRTQWRTLELTIEAAAKATTALDDTLDQIAKEIEAALSASPQAWLAGLAKAATLQSLDVDLTGTVDKPAGRLRMTYRIDYVTLEGEPDTAL